VTDRRDRLAGVEEVPCETDRGGLGAQEIGVGHPAGRHQRVILGGRDVIGGLVGLKGVGGGEVVERLDLAHLGRHQLRCAARWPRRYVDR